MPRKPNGTIMLLAPDHVGIARKVIDLKVMQRFPILDLGRQSWMTNVDGTLTDTSRYEHLSIPPDLRVHLTGARTGDRKDRLFLIEQPQALQDGSLSGPLLHLLTFVSAPVTTYPEPRNSSQSNRTWHQAAIIMLPADREYSAKRTRMFLDLFVHQQPYAPSFALHMPMAQAEMRLPFGERCILGPHWFQDLVRGSDMTTRYFFTLRFGYCEMAVDEACYIHCPPLARYTKVEPA